jgi:hypothetical protein
VVADALWRARRCGRNGYGRGIDRAGLESGLSLRRDMEVLRERARDTYKEFGDVVRAACCAFGLAVVDTLAELLD